MKKILSLIIVMSILLSMGVQSFAAVNEIHSGEISPRYISLMSIASGLDIDSLGIAECKANMSHRSSDGSCKLTMKLQKSNSSSWSTIATWSKEGTYTCENSKLRAVSSGTYRLCVIGKVYDSSGNFVESETIYSPTKTY